MSEIIKTNTEYSKWIKEVSLRFCIDSFDEILSLSNCTRFFRKSDFS